MEYGMRIKTMTATRLTLVAALVGAGIVALSGSAQAALTTSCVGTAKNVTVPGDLVVPAGQSCELTNVVVQGQTTVRADADLVTTRSTFKGRIVVGNNGYLDLDRTTVSKATSLDMAYGAYFQDSTLTGAVTVAGSGFLYSYGSTHAGQVTSTHGETYIESGRLGRGLTTNGDASTDLTDTVVNGRVSVAGAMFGSVICASEIYGNAGFSGAGVDGVVQLGTSGTFTDCGYNVFGSNVTVRGNQGPVSISGNVIRGNLVCSGNAMKPTGSDNRVRGTSTDQCKNLTPAQAAAAPMARSKMASPKDRANAALAKINHRANAGRAAATAAGTALIGR